MQQKLTDTISTWGFLLQFGALCNSAAMNILYATCPHTHEVLLSIGVKMLVYLLHS